MPKNSYVDGIEKAESTCFKVGLCFTLQATAKVSKPNAIDHLPKGQTVGYVRVSSFEQNESRQLKGLALDRVFRDKASGKNIQRPQLEALMKFVQEGDVVVCHSMDRLGRNLVDLRKTVG